MAGYDRPASGRGRGPPMQGFERGRGRSEGPGRGPERGRGPGGPGGGAGGRGYSAGPRGSLNAERAELDIKAAFMGLLLKTEPRSVDGLAARPNQGTAGQRVKIQANHFRLQELPNNASVFMYDVAIERVRRAGAEDRESRYGAPPPGPPPMPDRNMCYRIMNKCAQLARWPPNAYAYDGQKAVYTNKKFLGDSFELPVELFDVQPGQPASRGSQQTKATQEAEVPRSVKFVVRIRPTQTNHEIPIGEFVHAYKAGKLPNADALRDGMHGLDVALRQTAAEDPSNRMVQRGVYTCDDAKKLGFGIEAWHGYAQSLNVTQSGLTVSLDHAVTAMPVMEDLTAWLQETLRLPNLQQLASRELTRSEIETISQAVRRSSITVQVSHRANGKIRHKLRGFTPTSARTSMFNLKDGSETNVATYFEKHHGIKLRFPNLPCAIAGSSKRVDWFPLEVCRIVPDTGSRSLTGEQTSAILREAAVTPEVRFRKIINTLFNKAKLNTDKTAQAFGLKMEPRPEMMTITARVLPPPRLAYGDGIHVDPGQKGDWNIMNQKLYKTVTLESFAVVCYVPEHRVGGIMRDFLEDLRIAMEEKGIKVNLINWPPVVYVRRGQHEEEVLREAMQRAEVELCKKAQILFVIQERENQVYNEVKRICDTVIGVHSQVLVAANIKLGQGGAAGQMGRKMAGVALKVNTKLGGDNTVISGGNIGTWCPAVKKEGGGPPRVMLLGADVSHPTNMGGGGGQDPAEAARRPPMPSIASVVASINPECTRYACRILTQDSLTEMVSDMGKAVHELLTVWGNTNKTLPEVIIMFRDGVSEGQFRQCINTELKAIKDACAKFTLAKQPYTPKITFATVQKRHNTRFFPSDQASFDTAVGGKSGNVRPGAVVDTDICSPKEFDFYLNSHAGIQGTNKAAKYTVLYDDVGFSADSMQILSYWLCHTFCRCTRTVSYCPPAYYAHHAAFRGRAWLRREDLASDVASVTSGTSGTGSLGAWRWDFPTAHPNLKDTMFWI